MNILVLVEDLFARNGVPASFFRLAMRRHPSIRFLWPSRGADLRTSARGGFPANATPFAVDRSRELRGIAWGFVADAAEVPLALEVVAAAAALQGVVLDAVDVPSLSPVAHLVRPIFGALGVGVGRVVESWMGNSTECRRHAWPEPALPDPDGCQAAMEARAAAAVELRYGIVAVPPPRGGGAAATLPMTALFERPPAMRHPGGAGRASLYFRGHVSGEGGIDRFLRLAASLPRGNPLRCVLPLEGDPPAGRRTLLESEARRLGIALEIDPAAESALACGVAPAPAPIFDPAPLQALLRGQPVALSDDSWTAAALEAEGAQGLAPFRLDLGKSDAELAAILGEMLAEAGAAAADLHASLAAWRWSTPSLALEQIYGATRLRRRLPGQRKEVSPVLVVAALQPAQPRRGASKAPEIAAVVTVSGGPQEPVAALSATLCSLARQEVGAMEVVVVDDGTPDPVPLGIAVEAVGGFARLVRQGPAGAAAAMNRGLGETSAPFVCFLRAGSLAATDLLAAGLALLSASGEAAAAIPGWADLERIADGDSIPPPLALEGAIQGAGSLGPAFFLRRSAALRAGGFDITVGSWAALDLMLRLQAEGDRIIGLGGPARVFKAWPASPRGAMPGRDDALRRVLAKGGGQGPTARHAARIGA